MGCKPTSGGGVNYRIKKLLVCLANPFRDNELKEKRIAKRFDRLTNQCAEFIAYYKKKGYEVHYLPFYHGSDEKFIKRVQSQLQSNDKVLKQDIDYTLDTIDELFQQYEFGLCMRFHSILLSVKNALPIVAIEYDFKSEMLLKEAGLDEFGVKYGIRKSEFFGEEIDIQGNVLLQIAEKLLNAKDEFSLKASHFANKKHNEVLDNYERIKKLIYE